MSRYQAEDIDVSFRGLFDFRRSSRSARVHGAPRKV